MPHQASENRLRALGLPEPPEALEASLPPRAAVSHAGDGYVDTGPASPAALPRSADGSPLAGRRTRAEMGQEMGDGLDLSGFETTNVLPSSRYARALAAPDASAGMPERRLPNRSPATPLRTGPAMYDVHDRPRPIHDVHTPGLLSPRAALTARGDAAALRLAYGLKSTVAK